MIHNSTSHVEDVLSAGSVTGYIGFDPTAASLTLGNYVPIMLLKLFQLSGHKPIVLMGGATGRIGDPSGKDKERELKGYDTLDNNLNIQAEMMRKFLDFEGPYAAQIVNNLDFYRNMNALDFLRDVGKTLTVNYMIEKESVKRRLESGISFTEFSYQLLQGYDFQCLYQQFGCTLQMGGSDQWGNMTSGTEFIRKNLGGSGHVITCPLLTKADGTKFGKSESGNIWMSAAFTSPYRFYQFWLNADDRDVPKFTRYFTLFSRADIEAREATENIQTQKRLLAEELTIRVHGQEGFDAVTRVSSLLFGGRSKDDLIALSEADFATVSEEIPAFEVPKALFEGGVNVLALLVDHTSVQPSRAEARRNIQGGGLAINREKLLNHEQVVTLEDLRYGKYLLVEQGKKQKFTIIAL